MRCGVILYDPRAKAAELTIFNPVSAVFGLVAQPARHVRSSNCVLLLKTLVCAVLAGWFGQPLRAALSLSGFPLSHLLGLTNVTKLKLSERLARNA